MHLNFTASQIAFREKVRESVANSLAPAIRDKLRLGKMPSRHELVAWQRVLHAQGWAAPHWPREYGGAELGPVERLILQEELYCAPAPIPLVFNVDMLGPVLLKFGNELQKQEFLPKLANLDLWFCQGFSEPGAGSDLASLRTSARRDGDTYVVNGQKIWTTMGHEADWIFALVRTDATAKPQHGISFLLIDLRSPGVTVRPIATIDGQHHLNAVFFDNVRLPVTNRVGEEGQGWDCAKFLLANERTGIARVGYCRERLLYASEVLKRTQSASPALALDIAKLTAELRGLELTNWRFLFSQAAVQATPGFACVLKLKGTELQQKIAALLVRIAGPAGLERPEFHTEDPSESGAMTMRYFYSRSVSIYGGTSEIQKNILATTLLK
jgi:pimeloyl-CoA dehydrogenase